MNKGISIWAMPNRPLKDNFSLAATAGFDGVEVALDEEGELSLATSPAALKEIKSQAEACGLSLYSLASCLYWQYSLTDPSPAIRAKAEDIVKTQLEAASVLGCNTILVVPGAVRVSFSPSLGVNDYKAVYERSLEAMLRLKTHAEAYKVAIGIENVWNDFLLSPIEMRDFIDSIDSPYVGSYFDVGNVLAFGEPEHWINTLGSRIKKVHIKDFRRSVGTLSGFVDLLSGDVDFPSVMKALKDIGYDDWITAEVGCSAVYPEASVKNTSTAMDYILGRLS